MDNDYLNLLSSIGLQQKEAKVYLALLELEQGTVSKIAKLSGLKRPTIYLILDDLIKNGYVTELPDQVNCLVKCNFFVNFYLTLRWGLFV